MTPFAIALITAVAATSPRDVVRSGSEKLRAIVKKPSAKSSEILKAVEDFVDFAELARRSLGEAWRERNEKEREEFVAVMTAVLRANYEDRVRNQLDGEIEFGKEELDGDEAVVNATLKGEKEPLPLAYKLFKLHGAWKVYDLVVDEASLLDQYRSSFRKTIAAKGFAQLLAQLKAKHKEIEKRRKPREQAR